MTKDIFFKILERFAKFVETKSLINAAMYNYYAKNLAKQINLEEILKESPEIEFLMNKMSGAFTHYDDFIDEIIDKVIDNRKNSYAKYSNFAVSAAIITDDSQVYYGVNVENQSYGLTICAERAALFNAISAGQSKIAACIVSADTPEPIRACGACLQTLSEFMDTGIIISSTLNKDIFVASIDTLLPNGFKFKD